VQHFVLNFQYDDHHQWQQSLIRSNKLQLDMSYFFICIFLNVFEQVVNIRKPRSRLLLQILSSTCDMNLASTDCCAKGFQFEVFEMLHEQE
jgi:hypothetical protein